MMHRPKRLKITDLNPHMICVLCGGYYVDATTITECLHSFCKACIVRYLETNKYCPICDVLVHKTKPLQNIRSDPTLQNLVYKLVPGLFQHEMRCRREFYTKHPEVKPNSCEDGGEVTEQSDIYTPDESISLSLEYLNSEKDESLCTNRRFLRCPAAVTISHLQKLIGAKYGLLPQHRVDILFNGESLHESFTLMDVAYIYRWKRKEPLHLNYCIFESRIKRIKLENNAGESDADGGSALKTECADTNKNVDLEIMDNFQIVLNTQALEKVDCSSVNSFSASAVTQDNNNEWKEVQIQISENGIMSVTGITPEHNNNTEVSVDSLLPVLKEVESDKHVSVDNAALTSVLAVSKSGKENLTHRNSEPVHIEGRVKKENINFVLRESEQLVQESGVGRGDKYLLETTPKGKSCSKESVGVLAPPNLDPGTLTLMPSLSPISSLPSTAVTSTKQIFIEETVQTARDGSKKSVSEKPGATAKSSKDSVLLADSGSAPTKTSYSVSSDQKLSSSNIYPAVSTSHVTTLSRQPSHSFSAPGYKTSKHSPKSCQASKGQLQPSHVTNEKINENTFYGKTNAGNEKSYSTSMGSTTKHLADNSPSGIKQPRFFKMRTPRYLGNPASGVKPMFPEAGAQNLVSSSKSDMLISNTPLKSNSLTVTKIDPKTLSPIIVGNSTASSVASTPSMVTSVVTSNSMACAPSVLCSNSPAPVFMSSLKNHLPYSLPQNPFVSSIKGHDTSNLPTNQQSVNNKISSVKTPVSHGGLLPRNSCPMSNPSFIPNLPKSSAHLLYGFSNTSRRLSSPPPLTRAACIGSHIPPAGIGAFHPLPPSVNMLFNPHHQHHRSHNQGIVTASQTVTTPSIQRIPASNFHYKTNVNASGNNGICNTSTSCGNHRPSCNEEASGKEVSSEENGWLSKYTAKVNVCLNCTNASVSLCSSNRNSISDSMGSNSVTINVSTIPSAVTTRISTVVTPVSDSKLSSTSIMTSSETLTTPSPPCVFSTTLPTCSMSSMLSKQTNAVSTFPNSRVSSISSSNKHPTSSASMCVSSNALLPVSVCTSTAITSTVTSSSTIRSVPIVTTNSVLASLSSSTVGTTTVTAAAATITTTTQSHLCVSSSCKTPFPTTHESADLMMEIGRQKCVSASDSSALNVPVLTTASNTVSVTSIANNNCSSYTSGSTADALGEKKHAMVSACFSTSAESSYTSRGTASDSEVQDTHFSQKKNAFQSSDLPDSGMGTCVIKGQCTDKEGTREVGSQSRKNVDLANKGKGMKPDLRARSSPTERINRDDETKIKSNISANLEEGNISDSIDRDSSVNSPARNNTEKKLMPANASSDEQCNNNCIKLKVEESEQCKTAPVVCDENHPDVHQSETTRDTTKSKTCVSNVQKLKE